MEKIYTHDTNVVSTQLKDEERQPCEVWTRVMGYHRPVSQYNIGKQSEYAERKYFSSNKCCGQNRPTRLYA